MVSFHVLSLFAALALIGLGSSLDQQPLLPTEVTSSAPSKWQHPGYAISKYQLDFIKSKVPAKNSLWLKLVIKC